MLCAGLSRECFGPTYREAPQLRRVPLASPRSHTSVALGRVRLGPNTYKPVSDGSKISFRPHHTEQAGKCLFDMRN